jgi:peptidoglycan/LPS O-acetylase OafA/YrhL
MENDARLANVEQIAARNDEPASRTSGSRKIRSLDGLRTISVGLVIISHLRGHFSWTSTTAGALFFRCFDGALGVNVFFVISGFLITGLLLRERDETGGIDLGRFYSRRAFRILPALYFLLLVLLVLRECGQIHFSWATFLGALFFFSNYTHLGVSYPIAHTWSLSIEEQFYLLWPTILSRLNRKQAIRLCLVLIACAPMIRAAHYFLFPGTRAEMWQYSHVRYDSLLTGCALALLDDEAWFQALGRKLVSLRLHWAAIGFLLVGSPLLEWKLQGKYLLTTGYSLQAASIALVLFWAIRLSPRSLAGRFLNARLMRHFGVLSYSLYLWQQVFLVDSSGPLSKFPVNVVCIVLLAEFSYFVIEAPMLRIRDRWLAAPPRDELRSSAKVGL